MTRDTANDVAFKQLVQVWLYALEQDEVADLARVLHVVRGMGTGKIKRIRTRAGPRRA